MKMGGMGTQSRESKEGKTVSVLKNKRTTSNGGPALQPGQLVEMPVVIEDAAHYMDDYEIVLDSVAEAEDMGLQVNRNKCHTVPLDKPFRFCKCKFYLTETGRVITHGSRAGMKAARRKINYYKRKVDAGKMTVHNGKHWTSNVDANVWEPGVYGWTEAAEE